MKLKMKNSLLKRRRRRRSKLDINKLRKKQKVAEVDLLTMNDTATTGSAQ